MRKSLAARLDPDKAGGLRLTLFSVAAFLVLVPFALALVAVTDHWGPLQRLDLNVANRLNTQALSHPSMVTFLKDVSTIFSPTTFRILAVVAAVVLAVRGARRLALWLVVAVLLSGVLDTAMKEVVKRARPHFAHPVDVLTSYSFPSGHALGSVVGVGALLLVGLPFVAPRWRKWLIALGILIVLLVGYARVGLGVHYVSDVFGGWILGLAWLAVTVAAFRAWQHDLREPERPLSAGLEAPDQEADVRAASEDAG